MTFEFYTVIKQTTIHPNLFVLFIAFLSQRIILYQLFSYMIESRWKEILYI
jgi:hypothetical protein